MFHGFPMDSPWISYGFPADLSGVAPAQAIPLLTQTQLTSLDAACELHTDSVRAVLQDVVKPSRVEVVWNIWIIFPYGYGSIPIDTIFSGMNIHLPAISYTLW